MSSMDGQGDVRVVHLWPGLWLVEAILPDFSVRGALITGERRAVVFDTLAHPDQMKGVRKRIGGRPLIVVYSHGDWDHVWGTQGLAQPHAEVWGHTLCAQRFDEELPRLLAERRAIEPEAYEGVQLVRPTHTLSGPKRFDLGGVVLELHPLPGHTLDSVVGWIPAWNTLLAGDAVEDPLPFLNKGSPLEAWAEALEDWAARMEQEAETGRAACVVAAHGGLGDTALLRRNAVYLRALIRGTEPELPPALSAFYQKTHQDNLRLAKEARRRG